MDKSIQRTQLNNISLFDKIGYGSGNFGFGVVFQIIATYLVFYSTAVLDVPGKLVGLAISISVIWDGLTDPLMGYISDITKTKNLGRRHIYLLFGSVGMAVFNYILWTANTGLPQFIKFLWILAGVILIKSFMTIYATPYTALGAELSSDYNERTSIQGIKTVFFLIGLSFASVGGMFVFFKPTPEFPKGQLNPAAYSNMGLTASVLILAFGLVCFYTTKKYIPYLPKLEKDHTDYGKSVISLFLNFLKALNNRYYKYVVFGYLFTNISSALLGTIGLHVFTYTFMLDNRDIAYVVGAQLLVSVISQPLWISISRRIDKKPSVLLALCISIFGCLAFLALVLLKDIVQGNFIYLLPFSAILGLGTGGLFSLPLSMIADTIDVEEMNTGIRSEGTYYGCLTLFYKLSQSIAIFLLGLLLDIVKFDSSAAIQPDSTVITLGLILAVGSIIGFALAALTYLKYDLNRGKVDVIQRNLLSKRQTAL